MNAEISIYLHRCGLKVVDHHEHPADGQTDDQLEIATHLGGQYPVDETHAGGGGGVVFLWVCVRSRFFFNYVRVPVE